MSRRCRARRILPAPLLFKPLPILPRSALCRSETMLPILTPYNTRSILPMPAPSKKRKIYNHTQSHAARPARTRAQRILPKPYHNFSLPYIIKAWRRDASTVVRFMRCRLLAALNSPNKLYRKSFTSGYTALDTMAFYHLSVDNTDCTLLEFQGLVASSVLKSTVLADIVPGLPEVYFSAPSMLQVLRISCRHFVDLCALLGITKNEARQEIYREYGSRKKVRSIRVLGVEKCTDDVRVFLPGLSSSHFTSGCSFYALTQEQPSFVERQWETCFQAKRNYRPHNAPSASELKGILSDDASDFSITWTRLEQQNSCEDSNAILGKVSIRCPYVLFRSTFITQSIQKARDFIVSSQ